MQAAADLVALFKLLLLLRLPYLCAFSSLSVSPFPSVTNRSFPAEMSLCLVCCSEMLRTSLLTEEFVRGRRQYSGASILKPGPAAHDFLCESRPLVLRICLQDKVSSTPTRSAPAATAAKAPAATAAKAPAATAAKAPVATAAKAPTPTKRASTSSTTKQSAEACAAVFSRPLAATAAAGMTTEERPSKWKQKALLFAPLPLPASLHATPLLERRLPPSVGGSVDAVKKPRLASAADAAAAAVARLLPERCNEVHSGSLPPPSSAPDTTNPSGCPPKSPHEETPQDAPRASVGGAADAASATPPDQPLLRKPALGTIGSAEVCLPGISGSPCKSADAPETPTLAIPRDSEACKRRLAALRRNGVRGALPSLWRSSDGSN
ncbi:dead deah box helicase domain-containing protein [Cyclospora cayetanensis]|uniref:Dead deah box helicase domain-containing protein n=1 Tax=Cyclospora cayetanensis TaxID=88456 RepID=A0A1D3CYH8_9EIME|nr:dead deah box helicase domain-containing protein [Cyclospora cayetanensis]